MISPWYVGTTTVGLLDEFGPDRVIDTPVSENSITGTAVGAALAGMRPILMHPRMDFMYYAMDQIANHAANYSYMFGGQTKVPLTIWGIVNRGGEQAAQHRHVLKCYTTYLLDQMIMICATLTIVFYCLYTFSPDLVERIYSQNMVYSLVFVIYGIFRYIFHIFTFTLIIFNF